MDEEKGGWEVMMEMPRLNIWALVLFIGSKVFGIGGFALGFGGDGIRFTGGCLLGVAFCCLVGSIVFCLLQMNKDKAKIEEMEKEKAEIKKLENYRDLLEMKIKELEEKIN
jgi:TM2 domain-containing membrane protein YozV